jgi:hypothetical protein
MVAIESPEDAAAGADPQPGLVLHFALRLVWVAVRLILVICMGEKGVLFFYQGF